MFEAKEAVPEGGTVGTHNVQEGWEDALEKGMTAEKSVEVASERWVLILLMSLAFVLCNMDKVNMSVAVIPLAEELAWSASQRGIVSSAFFLGYALTQLPAGWIANKLGGGKVLLTGVAIWSFGTMLAPPAAYSTLWGLCLTRVLVGLGEGLAPAAAVGLMAECIPQKARARAVSLVFGGMDVGSVVGLLLAPLLIKYCGWNSVFYIFGLLGFLWCSLWILIETYGPGTSDLLLDTADLSSAMQKTVPWREIASCTPFFATVATHFCYNYGYFTLLAWLPSYFEAALGLDVRNAGWLTLIPYLAMCLMTPFVGPVADGLVARGHSVTRVRKIAQCSALLGPCLALAVISILTSIIRPANNGVAGAVVVLLSFAFAMGTWSRAGLYCNHQDLSPRYASVLLGISNAVGAIPGLVGVLVAGIVYDRTHSWEWSLFYPTMVFQVIGAVLFACYASGERQSWG